MVSDVVVTLPPPNENPADVVVAMLDGMLTERVLVVVAVVTKTLNGFNFLHRFIYVNTAVTKLQHLDLQIGYNVLKSES